MLYFWETVLTFSDSLEIPLTSQSVCVPKLTPASLFSTSKVVLDSSLYFLEKFRHPVAVLFISIYGSCGSDLVGPWILNL